jgi:hypothetical protein
VHKFVYEVGGGRFNLSQLGDTGSMDMGPPQPPAPGGDGVLLDAGGAPPPASGDGLQAVDKKEALRARRQDLRL